MYLEQVRTARSMNKHADVLTQKTQEIEKSNEVRGDENMYVRVQMKKRTRAKGGGGRDYTPLSAPHPALLAVCFRASPFNRAVFPSKWPPFLQRSHFHTFALSSPCPRFAGERCCVWDSYIRMIVRNTLYGWDARPWCPALSQRWK